MRAKGEAKKKYFIDPNLLQDLYLKQNKSLSEISKICNIKNKEQVRRRLIELNIPLREAKGYEKYTFTEEELKELYINQNLSSKNISDMFGMPCYGPILRLLKKYNIPISIEKGYEKARATLYKSGSCPTSKQQLHIHSLVGGELNYPVGRNNLDIAFPEEKIYIEYDGSGHDLAVKIGKVTKEKFNEKQRRRNYYMYRRGWKVIRLISPKDFLPDDDNIKYLIRDAKEKLNKTDLKYIDILLDKNGE